MPYTVDIPSAAVAAGAGASSAVTNPDQNNCRAQSRGRGGQQYQCGAEPTSAPGR
jgi:hypothetical protein